MPALDEEAYVLRLPLSLAARVRELMQTPGATRDMSMQVQFAEQPGFEPGRFARVRIGEDFFPATLMDLPTVVESAKSIDGVSFYKSGHVSQVLVVSEMMMTPPPPASYVERDGLTPPARRIRDFWAANQPMSARDEGTGEVERVEAKLRRIVDGQGAAPGDEDDGFATTPAGGGGAFPARAGAPLAPQSRAAPNPAFAQALQAAGGSQPAVSVQTTAPHTFQTLFGDSDDESDDESDPAEED
ncbi:TAFII55 protein conserved region-domain-containing protein [Pavlovales sp. CCMP2436]|nr:TAFII55 protein conserved region-domain-containing protein [Pavlovales sp. CCMP2436]|mmetsp:Transcript_1875/g.4866  ORF Transcript_1875/g.4866 Transcript_1875/m.4866 type:complete len:243 (-) Transcript_1875:90-818(-)